MNKFFKCEYESSIYSTITDTTRIQRDVDGNITDPRHLLKLILIDGWKKTKGIYKRMSDEQKANFKTFTSIGAQDFEDDNIAAARHLVDSLQGDEAEKLLENLKRLIHDSTYDSF